MENIITSDVESNGISINTQDSIIQEQQQAQPEFHIGSAAASAAGGDGEYKMFGNRRGAGQRIYENEGAAGTSSYGCRKYHMESDIFGTGMSPTHHSKQQQQINIPIGSGGGGSGGGKELGPAGRPSIIQHMDWFGRDTSPFEPKVSIGDGIDDDEGGEYHHSNEHTCGRNSGNARENGGNPITGKGYKEDAIGHTKRRQFIQPAAAKLW